MVRKGPRRLFHWLLTTGLCFTLGYLIAALLRRGPHAGVRAQTSSIEYRGNQSKLVLHHPSCRFYSSPSSSVRFSNRDQALAVGYQPCKLCNP